MNIIDAEGRLSAEGAKQIADEFVKVQDILRERGLSCDGKCEVVGFHLHYSICVTRDQQKFWYEMHTSNLLPPAPQQMLAPIYSTLGIHAFNTRTRLQWQ